ncbi:unnamed protein product (macronuclear) [Paramecium tetraurelia]|uniref:Uncharacterized protein n=1 Tax=Paramecium tetraurelia TaxID=5888 RepID=A0CXM7_PARTE|nr:uncharacterized protein GSPATT00011176001 [Paramecium tetraurelia]CAK75544.1 unnamed protein product [Paramecium tetraurelia]|eukprot:XP_001442941.1 hypothetical protein (macronuclear) [Paramecium tetraurelia strain d4-2]
MTQKQWNSDHKDQRGMIKLYCWLRIFHTDNKIILQRVDISVLLVFDITNPDSFHNVQKWYSEVSENTGTNSTFILVRNKTDLQSQLKITTTQAKAFADEYQIQYFETSAKTNQNIDLIFENTVHQIFEKIDKQLIDFANEVLLSDNCLRIKGSFWESFITKRNKGLRGKIKIKIKIKIASVEDFFKYKQFYKF